MTVTTTLSRISYIEDGVTTVFPVPFRFLADADLVVERILVDGTVAALTRSTDYSVTGADNPTGGSITRTAATIGATLRIRRQTPREQQMAYVVGDDFPAESHERALDRQMLISQEADTAAAETDARALLLPLGQVAPPVPKVDAAKYLATNVDKGFFWSAGNSTTDAGLRADLNSSADGAGAFLVAHKLPTNASVPLSVATVLGERVTPRFFGAIGDGSSHTVAEWLAEGRFATLAELQVAYPDVRTLADQIDFAAMNALVRYMALTGVAGHWDAGHYLGWIYAWYSNLNFFGAGESAVTIQVPDNATHVLHYGGVDLTGVPNVIDCNRISLGNDPGPISKITISGFTFDGNRDGGKTAIPPEDIFGWALAATQCSDLTLQDVRVRNAHAGGAGFFIHSDRVRGSIRSENNGKSLIGGAYRPGVDFNSSTDFDLTIQSNGDYFGARLLDNIFRGTLRGSIVGATTTGFIYYNQLDNASSDNDVALQISGGCTDRGAVIGPKITGGHVKLNVSDVDGEGYREIGVDQGIALTDRAINVDYDGSSTTRCKLGGAFLYGRNQRGDRRSIDDGDPANPGAWYAHWNGGNGTRGDALTTETRSPKVIRALRFHTGSDDCRVTVQCDNVLSTIDDLGTNNRAVGLALDWQTMVLTGGFVNTLGVTVIAAYAFADDIVQRHVLLRGDDIEGTSGVAAYTLPAAFRPPAKVTFFLGADKIVVNTDGTIVPTGTGPWPLNNLRFAI